MEASKLGLVLLATLLLHLSIHIRASSAVRPPPRNRNTEYIRASCHTTLYPKLCYRSLSFYASEIKRDPKVLTHTALNVTLKATKSTSRLMRRISRNRGLKPREKAAIADCVEEVGDSVDVLERSMGEMESVARSNFTSVMSDLQTWVSAAITNDDTCMDGCDEEAIRRKVKIIVRKHIRRIAHLASNALVFVNTYASNLP